MDGIIWQSTKKISTTFNSNQYYGLNQALPGLFGGLSRSVSIWNLGAVSAVSALRGGLNNRSNL